FSCRRRHTRFSRDWSSDVCSYDLIRTLKHIVTEGSIPGKEISFCGEMAADTLAIPLLIGLGYTSLSMSPSTIPYAKRIIRHLNYERTVKLAAECVNCINEKDIVNKLEKFFKDHNITRTRHII